MQLKKGGADWCLDVRRGDCQQSACPPTNHSIGSSLTSVSLVIATSLALTGCVTTQPQPDGSTKVRLSFGTPTTTSTDAAQPASVSAIKPAAIVDQGRTGSSRLTSVPGIRTTVLAGIFSKHPYDGSTNKPYFPRVAVTVTDWSRSDCWTATATVWWAKRKSEAVPAFTVCWRQSVGYAVNNAANLHLFMQQMAVENSGNVRTTGPKPPMRAITDKQPISERQQLAFQGFIQQLVIDTGWQAGAPTNLWLVGYEAGASNGLGSAKGTDNKAGQPMDAKTRAQLEQAFTCTAIGKRFDQAESALKQVGWWSDQGVTPIELAEPVQVFGFSVHKIAIARDGGEQTYRSFFPGVSLQHVVKSASLKLGKDGKAYGRLTKLGVLTAGMEDGEVTLTCTVNAEGEDG